MSFTDSFGSWFSRELKRRGWSQADFHRRSGVPRSTVSTWATGGRLPDPGSVDVIADAFGLDPAHVMNVLGHLPNVEPLNPNDPQELTAQRIRRMKWNRGRQVTIDGILNAWEAQDRGELK